MNVFIGYVLVVLSCPPAGVSGECSIEPYTDDVHPSMSECGQAKRAALPAFIPNGNETLECADVERPVEQ